MGYSPWGHKEEDTTEHSYHRLNPSSFMDAFTTELNILCVFVPTMV